jgi:hypothetical protein
METTKEAISHRFPFVESFPRGSSQVSSTSLLEWSGVACFRMAWTGLQPRRQWNPAHPAKSPTATANLHQTDIIANVEQMQPLPHWFAPADINCHLIDHL